MLPRLFPRSAPSHPPHLRRALLCVLALPLLWLNAFAANKPGGPVISIPLDPLGFTTGPARFLAGGATMYTVNFVDAQHILLTFGTKALLKRLDNEPPDDDDRSIAALLLELPTGKVLAKTVWRMHDQSRYLWPLRDGRFLLRIRNQLSVLDPVGNLATGDAFREQKFLDLKRRVGYVSVAPDGDVLAIQTVPPPEAPLFGRAAAARPASVTFAGQSPDEAPDPSVHIYLFRMSVEPAQDGPARLVFKQAGHIRAGDMIHIATTGEGYLNVTKEKAGTYDFDFNAHTGKKLELSAFDSSCPPRAYFVSRSEFIAFGCRGSDDRQMMSEFDLRGQEPWISVLPGTLYRPFILPAPEAGRFAFSHVLVTGTSFDPANPVPEELGGQEVTVYQNYDGRPLLKVNPTPVQTAGQNFDLAADGGSLAVIHDSTLDIYNLPPLTSKDQKEVKLEAATYPERNQAPILLNSVPISMSQKAVAITVDTGRSADASVVGDQTAQATAPVVGHASDHAPVLRPPNASDANMVGDVPAARTPPTLYDQEHPKPPSQ